MIVVGVDISRAGLTEAKVGSNRFPGYIPVSFGNQLNEGSSENCATPPLTLFPRRFVTLSFRTLICTKFLSG